MSITTEKTKNILDIIKNVYPCNSEGRYYDTFESLSAARDFAEKMRDLMVKEGIVDRKHSWDVVEQRNTRVYMTVDNIQNNSKEEEVLTAEGIDEKIEENYEGE